MFRPGSRTRNKCILVLIGATPEGKKELLGFTDGARESAQDWRELLLDLKNRVGHRAQARHRRRSAWVLEGHRRGLAGDAGAALLGSQDSQRPQQTAEKPAAESQARLTGNLDG